MRTKSLLAAAAFLVFVGAAVYADDRPDEGRIVKIDQDLQMMVVQDEDGDQWELHWTETTKMEGNATFAQLKPGDYVHFDYVEREGAKFLTEIRRTSRAKG